MVTCRCTWRQRDVHQKVELCWSISGMRLRSTSLHFRIILMDVYWVKKRTKMSSRRIRFCIKVPVITLDFPERNLSKILCTFRKMYRCVRRDDICSMGVWLYNVGRPTESSTKMWKEKCNFTFQTIAKVISAETEDMCGWLLNIKTQKSKEIQAYVPIRCGTSTSLLRKRLPTLDSLICMCGADDFLWCIKDDINIRSILGWQLVI